jgi:methyl-accepting chemotaxis protein
MGTATSANEIATSIELIAGKSVEQSKITELGVGKVFEMAQNIEDISKAVGHMNKIVEESNQLTSKGINTVSNLTNINGRHMKSSSILNGIVEEQLTTTEEVVEQSNNLEGLAESLLNMVERFKID